MKNSTRIAREQARIDVTQGLDTHCPWHRTPYSRREIGNGLTMKECESCRLNVPSKFAAASYMGRRAQQ